MCGTIKLYDYFFKCIKLLLALIGFLFIGCQSISDKTQEALKKSGSNRVELEQTIEHYKNAMDTLKLQALHYLIEQLPYYGTLNYKFVDRNGEEISIDNWNYKTVPDVQDDMVRKGLRFNQTSITEDAKSISKEYLISNINLAFEVWETYPWCSSLSFKKFCKRILPYKLNGDPLDNWRSFYYQKFKSQLDSLKALNASRSEVCFWLSKQNEKKWIKSAAVIPTSYLTYKDIERIGGGTCDHLAKNSIQLMRACGIPLQLDVIPFHGRINGGHAYNSFYTEDHQFVYFSPYDRDPERNKWIAPRVFRQVFEIQSLQIFDYLELDEIPPGPLRNPFFKDVTDEYFSTQDIWVDVTKETGPVFLCTYNNSSFHAITWGVAEKGRIQFNNVTKELLYFPMYYDQQVFAQAGDPFILRDSGSINILSREFNKTINLPNVEIRVVNKNYTRPEVTYDLYYWNGSWEFTSESRSTKDHKINFSNVKHSSLYLVKGHERLEQLQRPFSFVDGKIEHW